MEFLNQLIVIIPLVLVAIIALRWIWNIRQRRRGTLRLQIEDVPERDDDFELLRGELPNGGARIVPRVGIERSNSEQSETSDQGGTADLENAPVTRGAAVGEHETSVPPVTVTEGVESIGDEVPATRSSGPSFDSAQAAVCAPTSVSAGTFESSAAPIQPTLGLPIPPAEDAVEEGGPPESKGRGPRRGERMESVSGAASTDAENPIVIWVIARGDGFHGSGLLDVFSRNGLKYSQKSRVFARLGDDGGEQYLIANGVDPGTFDLADMERELVTPRVVLLLRPSAVDNPLPAFEDMSCLARDIAASLGGDLQDDARGAVSEQTIEHYRQRILDLTRRRMSRQADGS